MLHKPAIIDIRQRLGIPEEGFPNEGEALAWYREHYHQAKGKDFKGTFGFDYVHSSGLVNFKYEMGTDSLKIYATYPLDEAVPLDKEALSLANKLDTADWATPVFRLVILVGELPEVLEIRLPSHLTSPLGSLRVLVHPMEELSLRKWRKVGQTLGLLTGKNKVVTTSWTTPWTTTTYTPKRENSREYLYWQTLSAYMDAIGKRRWRGQKGKRGLLVETAKILETDYGWQYEPDSYTVRRYLDRAERIWHMSTHERP